MTKYFGRIGYFFKDYEVRPGVFEEKIIETEAYGDSKIIKFKTENLNQFNDGININVEISIIADQYTMNNISKIKYATYSGEKWKVTKVTPDYPRLILELGGVYND